MPKFGQIEAEKLEKAKILQNEGCGGVVHNFGQIEVKKKSSTFEINFCFLGYENIEGRGVVHN